MRVSRRMVQAEKLGVLFTILVAALGHTLYALSGKTPAVGLFFAVNNSLWEQLRLMILPYLLWAVWEALRYRPHLKRFLTAKVSALYLTLLSAIVLFYTYSGVLGFHLIAVELVGYCAAICFAFWFSHKLYTGIKEIEFYSDCALLALILLLIAFFGFTLAPLPLGIFRG